MNDIIYGDCLKVLKDIPRNKFDLVLTDPPFNVFNKPNLKIKNRKDIIQNDEFDIFKSYEEYLDFTEKWVNLVIPKMKDDSSFYSFFAIQYITDLMNICLKNGLEYRGIFIWHKSNPTPKYRKRGYVSSTEAILFMTKGNHVFNFKNQNEMHNFFESSICMGKERILDKNKLNKKGNPTTAHSTQKPLKLIKHLIEVSSNINDWVLDPFAGVGTTNKACQLLNRNCIGVEINKIYVKLAKKRLKESINYYQN